MCVTSRQSIHFIKNKLENYSDINEVLKTYLLNLEEKYSNSQKKKKFFEKFNFINAQDISTIT